jgi:hypothetical protein
MRCRRFSSSGRGGWAGERGAAERLVEAVCHVRVSRYMLVLYIVACFPTRHDLCRSGSMPAHDPSWLPRANNRLSEGPIGVTEKKFLHRFVLGCVRSSESKSPRVNQLGSPAGARRRDRARHAGRWLAKSATSTTTSVGSLGFVAGAEPALTGGVQSRLLGREQDGDLGGRGLRSRSASRSSCSRSPSRSPCGGRSLRYVRRSGSTQH